MALVSSIYRWASRPYHVEPVQLVAARASIKHLSSKAELSRTVEALKSYNGEIVVSVRHGRKHRVK